MNEFERKCRVPALDSGENPLRIPDNDPLLQRLYKTHKAHATRQQARDMAEAHAEGYHVGFPREGCPECQNRELREYP